MKNKKKGGEKKKKKKKKHKQKKKEKKKREEEEEKEKEEEDKEKKEEDKQDGRNKLISLEISTEKTRLMSSLEISTEKTRLMSSLEISTKKARPVFSSIKSIPVDVQFNDQRLEITRSFKHLGKIVTDEGSKSELLLRIAQVVAGMTKLNSS
ncbi:hypothetical protein ElyMa_003428100 [Elysia marginata]|uniref:Uncharacterized protein n=1 Tax=Elysia marginata TaxID=1093978 RepID=A0AAV4JQC0_9GAST|nr:hypothetical protein ElyMa_003428100 [Elysia marginata]